MSRYVSTAARRSKADCPMCEQEITSKTTLWGMLTKYFFLCKNCDLGFSYGYRDSVNDDIRVLIIQSICPVCHEDHEPEVVGKPCTDHIPCPKCWDEAKERETKQLPLLLSDFKLPNLIL